MKLPQVSSTHKAGAIFVPTTFIDNYKDLIRFINRLVCLSGVMEREEDGSEEQGTKED